LADRINSMIVELKDIDDELQRAGGEMELDPGRVEVISERLDALYGLQKKHRLQTEDELLALRDELGEKLNRIDSLDDKIEEARAELEIARGELQASALKLRKSRQEVLLSIEKEISVQLKAVALPNAVFKITLTEMEAGEYGAEGTEKIVFLFSANKGSDARDIGKVASGGELSRLMLCIKAMMARLAAMPTVIFDEIDTGISGETAARVGSILQQMASSHQVIAITHLPQIAAKGRAHFLVYKEMKKGNTRTHLRELNEQERVQEVARMLSGEAMTDAALNNARELLQSS
jgi:DNA repair protein RecN (Recombination protein N)